MQGSKSSEASVFQRFPEEAPIIRRLLLSSVEFRSICEDYAAAHRALVHFRSMSDGKARPEIVEYEELLEGLESEIGAAIAARRAAAKSGDPA